MTKARRALEKALKDVDSRLRGRPASPDLKFERARLLDRLGRTDEARAAYVELLQRDPGHFGALNDLGMLLFRAGARADAVTCFNAAVAKHPRNAIGRANLALVLLRGGDAEQACAQYQIALELDPANAEVRRGLALALEAMGRPDLAAEHRDLGFRTQPLVTLPYRGEGAPVRALLIVSASAGNVPTDRFLDDRIFATSKLVAEYYSASLALPAHDVIFNAIGDADVCAQALDAAQTVCERSGAPTINAPAAVRATGRIDNAARLAGVAGLVVPRAFAQTREFFAGAGETALLEGGVRVPFLLRTPGYHAGANLERVDRLDELPAVVARLPGQTLYAIEYVDYAGGDGRFRKYRAIFVGGRVYPLHVAISPRWKVHYFSAETDANAAYRAEEMRYLNDLEGTLGSRAAGVLQAVCDRLGLEYGGIDFALDRDGRPVLFEANATMIVPAPDDDPARAYRNAAIERIESAVRAMLLDRAATRTRRN